MANNLASFVWLLMFSTSPSNSLPVMTLIRVTACASPCNCSSVRVAGMASKSAFASRASTLMLFTSSRPALKSETKISLPMANCIAFLAPRGMVAWSALQPSVFSTSAPIRLAILVLSLPLPTSNALCPAVIVSSGLPVIWAISLSVLNRVSCPRPNR